MRPWWAGDSLTPGAQGLLVDGQAVAELARTHGTPLYVYSRQTVQRRVAAVRTALKTTGAPFRMHYALKANRYPPLLAVLRAEGDVGIDVCSPREVDHALATGFLPAEISVTAGMLSNRDLDYLVARGLHLNLDSFSALRRYGARVPAGTRVGLRLNPGVAVGYRKDRKLAYGDSKFGFYHNDIDAALAAAAAAGLVVDVLHVHWGWCLQAEDLPQLEAALARLAAFARRVPTLRTINVGGGLGVRHGATESPLPVAAWAEALAAHIAPLGLTIACEPGTFLVAEAGVLVAEVNTVEQKGGVLWAGVDAGHNINVYPYHYGIPLEIVPVAQPGAPPAQVYTVAGNINEAGDIWAEGRALPVLQEGDLLAFLPAGAYGASMASDHCLRGVFREVVV